MANYYEMLQVTPTASATEIETAYEAQYNQWRRLVTHHDPNIVNQANQALQTLEVIRDTLSDTAKRAVYDAGVGLAGPIGGLADPTALLQSIQRPTPPAPPAPPAPSTPVQMTAPPAPMPVAGLWHCGKCGTDNPPQTKFCFKCGNQLVRQCPECAKETSLIATGMCGECGYSYDAAMHRREVRIELGNLQASLATAQKEIQETSGQSNVGQLGCGAIILLIGLALLGSSLGWALVLLLFGGGILAMGLSGNSKRQGAISIANSNLQQLQNRQHQLQAELAGTTTNTALAMPQKQPQTAMPVMAQGGSWICSSCNGFVRQDAEFCKHCKLPFTRQA
jgi:hypothetical protein